GFTIAEDRLVEMPWQFESLQEAGEFCRQLFWMPSLDAEDVAAAMDREIGFDDPDGSPRLRWALRRIVCDALYRSAPKQLIDQFAQSAELGQLHLFATLDAFWPPGTFETELGGFLETEARVRDRPDFS